MRTHRRRLPHQYLEGKDLFLTWHLHGSLPRAVYPPPGKLNAGRAFVWIDRYLDAAREGPAYLRREKVAEVVRMALVKGVELSHYLLHAYVIMANHVHILVSPWTEPSRFLQSLKGVTAREANLILNRTGQPFWQRESYDHWVRNQTEWKRIKAYIEENPVRAGLVGRAEDYRWSSAWIAPHATSERGL